MTATTGRIIIAPCATGKSHYLREHPECDWIEGDDLYKLHNILYYECELAHNINIEYKKLGMKIITSTWWTLDDVDAIIFSPIEILIERCRLEPRPDNNPEEAVELLRKASEKMANPPQIFFSIEEVMEKIK